MNPGVYVRSVLFNSKSVISLLHYKYWASQPINLLLTKGSNFCLLWKGKNIIATFVIWISKKESCSKEKLLSQLQIRHNPCPLIFKWLNYCCAMKIFKSLVWDVGSNSLSKKASHVTGLLMAFYFKHIVFDRVPNYHNVKIFNLIHSTYSVPDTVWRALWCYFFKNNPICTATFYYDPFTDEDWDVRKVM